MSFFKRRNCVKKEELLELELIEKTKKEQDRLQSWKIQYASEFDKILKIVGNPNKVHWNTISLSIASNIMTARDLYPSGIDYIAIRGSVFLSDTEFNIYSTYSKDDRDKTRGCVIVQLNIKDFRDAIHSQHCIINDVISKLNIHCKYITMTNENVNDNIMISLNFY
jgi:hypothetical protein